MQTITTITSNGGGQTYPIGKLLERLATETLDPVFEEYGNFVTFEPTLLSGEKLTGITHFFGNFYTYSHVFSIDTNDAELIHRLTVAIRANQATEAYQQARKERGL